jgi:hypothetical protein
MILFPYSSVIKHRATRTLFQLSGSCHNLPLTGLRIYKPAKHLYSFSNDGSFTCHTYCDTGPPSLRSYPKEPWFSILNTVFFVEGAITSYFKRRPMWRREVTPVNYWPPVNILRQGGHFFSCRKPNQTINSTVSRRIMTSVEYWPGVTFLRRKVTHGSLFYGSIFLQPTRRKVTPVEYWPGSHIST